ncbi:hypothetical protein [Vulcanococcus sp.]|jgi:hypothetical protein|uniref:hypothetical protein n=1 Tax=Vulcanococcus sp. TaxID=2856995 RepID=UPI00322D500E
MDEATQFIKDLVGEVRPLLRAPASLVRAEREWSFSSICAVIDARGETPQVVTSTVGTINSVVVASSALDHPILQTFLKRARDEGPETALAAMLEGEDADDFAEVYERFREEQQDKGKAVWSVGDSAAFAAKAREAWNDQELACIAITPGATKDSHGVLTFSLPLDWLS